MWERLYPSMPDFLHRKEESSRSKSTGLLQTVAVISEFTTNLQVPWLVPGKAW